MRRRPIRELVYDDTWGGDAAWAVDPPDARVHLGRPAEGTVDALSSGTRRTGVALGSVAVGNLVRRLRGHLRVALELVRERVGSVEGVQNALVELWRMNASDLQGRRLDEFGFSVTSQTDEDENLLHIFAIVGTTNRRVVEICAGHGIECNAANLVLSHGWHALLIDGDPLLVDIGNAFTPVLDERGGFRRPS